MLVLRHSLAADATSPLDFSMKTLGLTGGIGMGKSTVAEWLRERPVCVVDTDEIARQVVAPGQSALTEIRGVFGAGVFAPDGTLQRAALAEKIFADVSARRRLEAILHPRIRAEWRAQLDRWRAADVRLAVVVIPLLFEIEVQAEFDVTICVSCSAATQHQRLRARGWPPAQIAQRIQAQLPVAQKMARASYVLWNEGDRSVLAAQLDSLFARWG